MKKTFFSLFVIALFAGTFSFAGAVNPFNIVFPVAELGNCASQAECKIYCDVAENQNACLAFAEARGFVPKEKIAKMKKFKDIAAQGGPGGCTSNDTCRAYCADPIHQDECITFAKEHELIDKEEIKMIERGRDLSKKVKEIGGPGGCKSEKECKTFCADPANQDVCLQFALDNNLIPKEKIAKMKKFKDIAAQGGPGGCTSNDTCRAYCADPIHQDECITFAKEHELIDKEEIKMIERGRDLSKKVKEIGGPGGCKSEQECHAYCAKPENMDACLAFAVEHGGFKQEEAQHMMREFIKENIHRDGTSTEDMMEIEKEHMRQFEHFREIEGKFRKPEFLQQGQMTGPGGCMTPQECVQYCSDPSHRSECAQFNPSTGNLPPGMLFRQGEPGGERQIRGIKPFSTSTVPFQGNTMPFRMMPPQQEEEDGDDKQRFQACTQEFKPVCGMDGRTYPNECFAKNNNVKIMKEGMCDFMNNLPSGTISPEREMMNPTQPFLTPQPRMMPPPESRNVSDISFGMVFDAFKNIMPR